MRGVLALITLESVVDLMQHRSILEGFTRMVTPSVPLDGDVVVREETRDTECIYVLRTFPGPDQLVLPRYEQAARHALAFAKRQHVNVWVIDDESAAIRLQDF